MFLKKQGFLMMLLLSEIYCLSGFAQTQLDLETDKALAKIMFDSYQSHLFSAKSYLDQSEKAKTQSEADQAATWLNHLTSISEITLREIGVYLFQQYDALIDLFLIIGDKDRAQTLVEKMAPFARSDAERERLEYLRRLVRVKKREINSDDNFGVKMTPIVLALSAVASGGSALWAKNAADKKYEEIDKSIPHDQKFKLWGETNQRDGRYEVLLVSSAAFGIMTVPYMLDWLNIPGGQKLSKGKFVTGVFAISAASGIGALYSHRKASEKYDQIPTNSLDDRLRLWGETKKWDERSRLLTINAGITAVVGLATFLWYDPTDGRNTDNKQVSFLPKSVYLSFDVESENNQRMLFRLRKSF